MFFDVLVPPFPHAHLEMIRQGYGTGFIDKDTCSHTGFRAFAINSSSEPSNALVMPVCLKARTQLTWGEKGLEC